MKSNVKKLLTSSQAQNESLYSNKVSYDSQGNFLSRKFGRYTVDSKRKTANQFLQFLKEDNGISLLEETPKVRRWVIIQPDGRRYNAYPSDPFEKEIEIKNGIKCFNLTTRLSGNS